ncbi:MAG: xanthine dehydrogenase family protein molybdopterin-binding subunit [Synergistaceae bacterium]|nr:xanthine dehydrogenase family protein molybdopterin-binding subunit [Synergistaceae bacterium]
MTEFSIIGRSLLRDDGIGKVSGRTEYIADIEIPGCWVGGIVRSQMARGKLKGIRRSPSFDWSQVTVVTHEDIPGENFIAIVRNDYPALAAEEVNYCSQAVALVAAPDEKLLKEAMASLTLETEALKPVLTMEESLAGKEIIWGSDNIIDEYLNESGDIDKGFAEADVIVEGDWATGFHEQLYLETQGMAAWIREDGALEVIGSMQCPYYVHGAVQKVMGLPSEKVIIKQAATGGGFGGKEDYPSILGSYAALLAMKSEHPVRIIFDREEDLLVTPKRHPSKSHYRMGLKKDGKITALDADILLDSGAYTTLSRVVLQRSQLHACGIYFVPNVRIRSRAIATNTPPNGAYRGFGAPQSIFAMERQMDLAAKKLDMDPLDIRLKNALRTGDRFPYGQILKEKNNAVEVLEKAAQISDYRTKRELLANQPEGRIKKGIGIAAALHGGGFTGAGEDRMGTTARVCFDGERFCLYVSSTEIGQGASMILRMVAAEELGIDIENVLYMVPDTSKSPNTGPTVASRTTMYASKAVCDACTRIKKKLTELRQVKGLPENTDLTLLARIYLDENTELDELGFNIFDDESSWDEEKFEGDAYRAYSWIANVIEVEVDTDTYEVMAKKVYAAAEVGRAVNPMQLRGQITGGLLQAIGWSHMEDIKVDEKGKYTASHMNSYLVPTALDTPEWEVELLEAPCSQGCFGAKGIGELPMNAAGPAFTAAVDNAAGVFCDSIPCTGEKLFRLILQKENKAAEGGIGK